MILCVVGARPNFVKMAPIVAALKNSGSEFFLVHTGQHYAREMSDLFFEDLGFPQPHRNLGAGSGTHALQTARIMELFEPVCAEIRPDLVLVAGDVNSTLACALTAAKMQIPVGHVESGLRSFDRSMPEEINRIMTDHLSEILFVSEPSGRQNLLHEGIDPSRIHDVGNTMIDSLFHFKNRAEKNEPWKKYRCSRGSYGLITLHRPENADHPERLMTVISALIKTAQKTPLLFPVHPRTKNKLEVLNVKMPPAFQMLPPLGYLEFLGLMAGAGFVVTDSGGVQEETTALSVPCLTIRRNTERPVTLTHGSNQLVGEGENALLCAIEKVLNNGSRTPGESIPLWDGKAALRIADVITRWMKTHE